MLVTVLSIHLVLFYAHMCIFDLQLLGISAIILANLCVSYIMTSHTEEVHVHVHIWLNHLHCVYNNEQPGKNSLGAKRLSQANYKLS